MAARGAFTTVAEMASEIGITFGLLSGMAVKDRKKQEQSALPAEQKQILPKDLLVHARKVERAEIAKAVASEIAKGRKLPRRIPVSALPSTDMPGFGSAIVTIDGKDYENRAAG